MRATRRTKLLHVITRLDPGGSAENTLISAAGLDPARYEVTIAVGPTQGTPSVTEALARDRGVRFVDVPDLVRAVHPVRDVRAYRHLSRLLRERFDIVHTHTSKAGILGRLAAHRAGVPGIVHTPHGHVFYGYHGPWVTGLFVRVERRAARWCHRLVALTAADREDHLRFGVGRAAQWVVIHSGVDFRPLEAATDADGAALRAQLGLPSGALVIGSVGRLTAVKAQDVLLRAVAGLMRCHGDVHLLFVGEGEQRPVLQGLARELGVADRTVFAGWHADVAPALRAMDVFALPSHNEGMGKALVEAMYVGLPVVATDVGGIPELIDDEVQGLRVPPADVAALGDALERLVADADLRQRLGRCAAVRARDYGDRAMIASLDGLYQELLAAAAPSGAARPSQQEEADVADMAR